MGSNSQLAEVRYSCYRKQSISSVIYGKQSITRRKQRKELVKVAGVLRLVTVGRNLGVTSHTPIQLCLCGMYLMKREVLVVTS